MISGTNSPWRWLAAMLLIAFVVQSALVVRADGDIGEAPEHHERVVRGDGFSVRVRVDQEVIRTSDRLRIRLEIESESPMIRGYDIEAEETPLWMVRRRSAPHQAAPVGLTRAEFVIEPYLAGDWLTPRFVVTPEMHDGRHGGALVIDPIEVRVLSVLDEDGGFLAEVLGVVDPPESGVASERNFLITTIALGGVLLGGAVIALALRRRSGGPAPESCDAAALRRLDELGRSGLIHEDTMDRFYLELTAILREYIEQRFGVNAPDRTTQEFLRDAALAAVLTDEEHEELGALLEHADAVKFARAGVGRDEAVRSLMMAREFIARSGQTAKTTGIPEAEVSR
ncbi:MAG: hypothetical protein EA380_09420 [Phycisphaeraceae bacterium]|nr:MAG: hypothetical protein EA380_09420 [Phycisphaeraceae bacterium]